jgi:hypothetical protein
VGRSEAKRILSVVAHASLVDVADLLFKMPLYYTKGSLKVYSSLAILLPEEASESRLFRLLNAFDAFTIWKLVLVTLGLSIVTGRPRSQSALMVWVPWLLWVALTVALHDLFAGLSRAG